MNELILVKIGGNVIDNEKDLQKFLLSFSKIKGPKILVHGGGILATQLSARLGIETKMFEGRRITDAETLKISTMVYAGWINKSIVCKLNAMGTRAIGLCGADVSLIPSTKRKKGSVDYGFVGDVLPGKINVDFLKILLKQKITPVISPITGSDKGQLLNTNADTIAAALASSLSSSFKIKFIYCFEKNGVLNANKVLKTLNQRTFEELKQKKIIKDGMIPKLDNAFKALNKRTSITIGNSAHLQKLITQHAGTHITN
jgi:acetylglutamate kinase